MLQFIGDRIASDKSSFLYYSSPSILFGETMRRNSHISIAKDITEQKIGRRLESNEVVHHINGDKQNLQLMFFGNHTRLHCLLKKKRIRRNK